jgi:hypothetical protein
VQALAIDLAVGRDQARAQRDHDMLGQRRQPRQVLLVALARREHPQPERLRHAAVGPVDRVVVGRLEVVADHRARRQAELGEVPHQLALGPGRGLGELGDRLLLDLAGDVPHQLDRADAEVVLGDVGQLDPLHVGDVELVAGREQLDGRHLIGLEVDHVRTASSRRCLRGVVSSNR